MKGFDALLAERAFEAVTTLRTANGREELDEIIEPVLASLGLSYFGVGRFFGPVGQVAAGLLNGNLPDHWVRHYARCGYAMHSPLAREMLTTSLPYRWESVVQRGGQNRLARRILNEAGDFGLRDGLYIPMREATMVLPQDASTQHFSRRTGGSPGVSVSACCGRAPARARRSSPKSWASPQRL